jgi:D-sedoheptulose 7-phosphate isomerase
MKNEIIEIFRKSIDLKSQIIIDDLILKNIEKSVDLIVNCYKNQGKVLFCGNGGSAADSQHLAAELSGRFYFDREPLYAEALHVNTSYVTAVANDYSYDDIYSRYISGSGRKGDILIGLSTSGKSKNVIKAFQKANELDMTCIGLTGLFSDDFSKSCEVTISIPSSDTPRIQECHLLIGHIICQKVEEKLFRFKLNSD